MRICHIIESTNAGSSRVVVELARSGVAAGEDVTVIYSRNRAEQVFIDDLVAIDGLHLVETPMQREVGLHDIVAGWRLLRALIAHGPFDVIHAHSSKAGGLARLAGLFMPGAAKVYAPHAFVTLSPDARPIYGLIERLLSHVTDAIVVLSEQERRHATEVLHIAPDLLHLIPNGVSAAPQGNRAAIRAKLRAEDDSFVIGFVGRLVEQKNPVRAVKAFALVAPTHPQALLAVIGGGPLEPDVLAAARAAGVAERVRMVGYAPARDYMPAFDCLLCSSDYESSPLIFPEALMAGVPLVSTNVGTVPELQRPEGPVFAVADLTPEALADGLDQLLRLSPEQRLALREAARRFAAPYSAETMYGRTFELYRRLRPHA
ncbi:glycosyltransferase involved in cell wall biosynthesis [Rhodoblastus acidophilus]|uniref:glycosyltransferase family 4 protein n=1 Tax=Rhodoblastus acidophilus TaxID=1074 RepID=UPI002225AFA5|nr:glycosyltransferase family 4 protein [Rhodoblastus acidophilus]MCW2283551.1 glycosyltransferase involved in cell wall biosynthesis [Rhodoblastus acidophilus]MCW2332411.1 glycosyltransferase involved in cell wall biosynthesis [Rhodoblastus acidophilus]